MIKDPKDNIKPLPKRVRKERKIREVDYVCHECGVTYGRWYRLGEYNGPPYHCPTYHMGRCSVCNKTNLPITEQRDYGYVELNGRGNCK
jgi:hypothetical protein